MRIKCLLVEFHVFCFRVLEIRSRAALRRYKGHILIVAGFRHYPAWLCYAWYMRFVGGRRDHKAVGSCGWCEGLRNGVLEETFFCSWMDIS